MPLEKANSMVAQLKRGTLAMLVLYLLQNEDMYGYQIAQTLDERSEGKLRLIENSLYGTVYRLQREGYISSKKEENVARARVFYHLEPSGEVYLAKLIKEYESISEGIRLVIGNPAFSQEEIQ